MTTIGSQGLGLRSRLAKGMLAASVLIFLVLTSTGIANAAVVRTTGRYAGTATVPSVLVEKPYAGSCDSTGCSFSIDDAGHITSRARTIYENGNYGASWQYVCVTHRLWRYSPGYWSGAVYTYGSWHLEVSSGSRCGWISPTGTSIRDSAFRFDLLKSNSDHLEWWAVDVMVTWQLQNGTQLGKKTYDYVHLNDYECATSCGAKDYTTEGDAIIMI